MFKFLQTVLSSKTPRPRSLYAFTKHRRGDFVLFIQDNQDVYECMQLPDLFQVFFTAEEFNECINEKLLDFVECLPESVFEVCVNNIKK